MIIHIVFFLGYLSLFFLLFPFFYFVYKFYYFSKISENFNKMFVLSKLFMIFIITSENSIFVQRIGKKILVLKSVWIY